MSLIDWLKTFNKSHILPEESEESLRTLNKMDVDKIESPRFTDSNPGDQRERMRLLLLQYFHQRLTGILPTNASEIIDSPPACVILLMSPCNGTQEGNRLVIPDMGDSVQCSIMHLAIFRRGGLKYFDH